VGVFTGLTISPKGSSQAGILDVFWKWIFVTFFVYESIEEKMPGKI
jgi:hypothetical protein